MTENKRFHNIGVTVFDNLAKSKTIDVTNEKDAEILVTVLNNLYDHFCRLDEDNEQLKQQILELQE